MTLPELIAETEAGLEGVTPFEQHVEMAREALTNGADICLECGQPLAWPHDHQPDQSGLDDGPWLPGHTPRKKSEPKPAEELTEIRTRDWVTRRAKYGERGHR